MSTLQQALDRMTILASGLGRDANKSPVIDNDVTAFVVWPHAIRSAVYTVIARGDDLQDLMQEHEITITDGVGTLPATIIREGLDRAIWEDRPHVKSLSFADYQQALIPSQPFNPSPTYPHGISYYALLGSSIYFRDGATLTEEYTGDITVFAPTLDALPADSTEEMELPDRLVDTAISLGASVLGGQMPLAELIKSYMRIFHQPKSFNMGSWRG
jgi:hypothetical protein